jgi:peptide/nickel transport system permease protein
MWGQVGGILWTTTRSFTRDRLGIFGLAILSGFILLAIFAGVLSPYDPWQTDYHPDGRVVRMEPPSSRHWFGTDRFGRDILSQTIHGSRVALFVGLISALCSCFIGVNIGLVAGYFGGKVDDILMRFTDVVYGIPFLPFAMILIALVGPSLWSVILAITLITWRTPARAIRSQVLSLKHRGFVDAARVSGCGPWRILYIHIAPNILSLAFAYTVITVGWSILTEASLSFLGYGDPERISWGKTLFMAYVAQAMQVAWWWVVPPGLAITAHVLAFFFVGRTFEEITNPKLREE